MVVFRGGKLLLRLDGVSLEGGILIGDKKTAFPTSNTATFTSINIFMCGALNRADTGRV